MSTLHDETDLPRLGKDHLKTGVLHATLKGSIPDPSLLDLPEKVLQFGTGAFLRGFTDYFIDRANRNGLFMGRVVMVGSTGSGRSAWLNEQDGLYTLCEQGLDNEAVVDRCDIISSVSRALSAQTDWGEVLALAVKPELELVVSNTTEVGITYDPEDRMDAHPPRSFPGKLTTVLFERGQAFDWSAEGGLVVLPCELLEDNGDRLKSIVLKLARLWGLGAEFETWLNRHVRFVNTLVDRIVTGTPAPEAHQQRETELGYRDRLLTVAEVYRLWALEGDDELRQLLRFAGADPGIEIAADITPFRELKVRILNGAHTTLVPVGLLAGCEMVKEAMDHPLVGGYIRRLILHEIVPSLDLDLELSSAFAKDVTSRFCNPFIVHPLRNISLQTSRKTGVRVLPSVIQYAKKYQQVPRGLAFGLACLMMLKKRQFEMDLLEDDFAPFWATVWEGVDQYEERAIAGVVHDVGQHDKLWGVRWDAVPGLNDVVKQHLMNIIEQGMTRALNAVWAP